MLQARDNARRCALSQLTVSMWPLWETNGERHAVTVKPSAQPGVDRRLLNTTSPFFYLHSIHFHPPLLFLVPLCFLSPFSFFCFPFSLLMFCWCAQAVSKSKKGCVVVMGNMPSLRWGKSWRRTESTGIFRGFRSVCFVSGQWKESGATAGWTALFEERMQWVSKQVRSRQPRVSDRLNNVLKQWVVDLMSVSLLRTWKDAHRNTGAAASLQSSIGCVVLGESVILAVCVDVSGGFMCINTSADKHGCGFGR